MARRNDHSREELLEMAIQAAEKLVVKEGVAGLTARKVAAEIGYSAGTLYKVFNNLDDLCWRLNERTLKRLLVQLEAIRSEKPERLLEGYGRCYLQFANQYPQQWSMLFEHRSLTPDNPPEWLTASINDLFLLVERALALLFPTMGVDRLQLSARTLWSGVHGITVLQQRDKLFTESEMAAEQMLQQLLSCFLVGLAQEVSADA